MRTNNRVLALALTAALLALPLTGGAVTLLVEPGESIQDAIDAAADGDVVSVAAGVYDEDINLRGKAISVVGTGADSVIRGSGTGPVVTIASGEGTDTVVDSFTITGGSARQGGGVYVAGASPILLRNVITGNLARVRGSGVYLEASNARLYNNLIVYNGHAGSGDPHGVEIVNASPWLVNNTIAYGDSNGIIIRGASAPLIMNNVIARNGSVEEDGSLRGRGICDFSVGGTATIHYNVFHRNRVGALLTDGTDYGRIRYAQQNVPPPRLLENRDGSPGFRGPRLSDPDRAVLPDGFHLDPERRSAAIDSGNPEPIHDDLDGTRNDAGFTGGPFAMPRD
jgi:Periplasmic copper-binding protein (NosD)